MPRSSPVSAPPRLPVARRLCLCRGGFLSSCSRKWDPMRDSEPLCMILCVTRSSASWKLPGSEKWTKKVPRRPHRFISIKQGQRKNAEKKSFCDLGDSDFYPWEFEQTCTPNSQLSGLAARSTMSSTPSDPPCPFSISESSINCEMDVSGDMHPFPAQESKEGSPM